MRESLPKPPAGDLDQQRDTPLPGSRDPGALAKRRAKDDPDARLTRTGPLAWMANNSVAANLMMFVLVVGGFASQPAQDALTTRRLPANGL